MTPQLLNRLFPSGTPIGSTICVLRDRIVVEAIAQNISEIDSEVVDSIWMKTRDSWIRLQMQVHFIEHTQELDSNTECPTITPLTNQNYQYSPRHLGFGSMAHILDRSFLEAARDVLDNEYLAPLPAPTPTQTATRNILESTARQLFQQRYPSETDSRGDTE